jgi:hypothetical protein
VDHLGIEAAGLTSLTTAELLPGPAPGHDSFFFMLDLDWAFRMWAVLLAAALAAVRATACWSAARRLLTAGYGTADIQRAFKARGAGPPRDPRRVSRTPRWSTLGAVTLLVAGYWLAGRDLVADWPAAVTIPAELAGLIAATAIGRTAAVKLLSRRGQTPEWWDRLWAGRLGGLLMRVAGLGLGRRERGAPRVLQHTEIIVGQAAEAIFDTLERHVRRQLAEVPGVLARLQAHAENLRLRLEELERTRSEAGSLGRASRSTWRTGGGGTHEQVRTRAEQLADSLDSAGDDARDKLAAVVAAMESIRLNLLRLRAGIGTPGDLSADLEAAREIERAVDALLAGRREADEVRRPAPDATE